MVDFPPPGMAVHRDEDAVLEARPPRLASPEAVATRQDPLCSSSSGGSSPWCGGAAGRVELLPTPLSDNSRPRSAEILSLDPCRSRFQRFPEPVELGNCSCTARRRAERAPASSSLHPRRYSRRRPQESPDFLNEDIKLDEANLVEAIQRRWIGFAPGRYEQPAHRTQALALKRADHPSACSTVLARLRERVPPTPFQASEYPNRPGVPRFEKISLQHDPVRQSRVAREDEWYLVGDRRRTRSPAPTPPTPEEFMRGARGVLTVLREPGE